MQTEKIRIYNNGQGMEEALALTGRMAGALFLDSKNSSRLRLLTEEMLSMVRSIAGDFSADFWIDTDITTCRLNLEAKTNELEYAKRREFLDVSTKGKNIAARGIMEKIREIIEAGLYSIEESYKLQAEYGGGMMGYGALGMIDDPAIQSVYWSMHKYKESVEAQKEENPAAEEAWDELEKSIIANIADEVQVGVSQDSVKLIVAKKI